MSDAKDLARQLLEEVQREQMTHSGPKDEPQTETQRFRAAMQGLTFGGADEAEAYMRSVLTGKDYDTILSDVRGKLEKYKGERPWEALGYEVGGAVVPAIAASLFTGGGAGAATSARFFPTLAKLWKAAPPVVRATAGGAAGGGAYAFGTGEDGFENRARRVVPGMVAGAAGGAGGYALARGGSKLAGDFIDYVSRKAGGRVSKRVEQELAQVVADSGMTTDEVLRRVQAGELLAEMSPTLRSVARGYFAQSRGAATTLSNTYRTRPDALRGETLQYMQKAMTGNADDNVLRTAMQGDEAVRRAAGAEYNSVFSSAGALSEDAIGQIKAALSRVPEAGDDVAKIYRAQTGKTPFFSIDKKGNVTFSRPPTLEDAEIIRRGIDSATSKQFRTGAGPVGAAYRDVEGGLRQAIDDASKPLSEVRAKWANIEGASKAFDQGRRALGRSPDEVAVEFDAIVRQGDDAVAAYRAGIVDAFRKRASTGSAKSLPRNIADPERKEGLILRTVFPEDNLDEFLGLAQRATNAQDASNQILGGSPTAITQGRNRQTGGDMLSDAVEVGMGNNFALVRLASQAIKAMRPSLTDKEIQRLAGLMVESNPAVLRDAMTNTTAIAQVNALAQQFLDGLPEAAARGAGRSTVPVGETMLGPNR